MKKIKMFAIVLCLGWAAHYSAMSQASATDTNQTGASAPANAADSNAPAMATAASETVSAPGMSAGSNNPPPDMSMSNAAASSAAAGNAPAMAPASSETVSAPEMNAGSNNPPPDMSMSNAAMSSAAASNAPAMAVGSNQPVSLSASNEMAGAGSTNPEAAGGTNGVPVAAAGTNGQPAAAGTNATAALLPIQFQDVPITTAIDSLARLAGINYLLDPKIGYGQPDQNGVIKPEPTLSVRWENVTAEQALLALLDNYGLEMVDNPKTHIAKITTKQPNAQPPLITRVVQLKYASTSNMLASVVNSLTDKRSRVVADPRTDQLVVIATEEEQADVDTLITDLDKPTRQVLIEMKLVEISSNPSTSKGIDWSGTLGGQNISFGNGVLNEPTFSSSTTLLPGTPATTPGFGGIPTTTTPGSSTISTLISEPQNSLNAGGLELNSASGLTPNIGFLSADGVKAVLSFLNQSSEAQVVSTPRVVTLDNETATLAVTRGYPVINVTAGTVNAAGGSTINYSNIGTVLSVTPRITANDYIWLKVIPDVSSFFGTVNKTIGGQLFQADEFDSRHIETQVLIPDAHTLVMGGLVKDDPNAQYTKVPILGDIPLLGVAFRSENKSMEKDNLLIFITPTIVKDTDFQEPLTTGFLQSKSKTMEEPMNMHTWLDSAQPRGNWSDPAPPAGVDKTQTPDEGKESFAP